MTRQISVPWQVNPQVKLTCWSINGDPAHSPHHWLTWQNAHYRDSDYNCIWACILNTATGHSTHITFMGSVHRKYIPVHIQQDETLHSLFIYGNCSTCFGWYLHPSSGEHTTVSNASNICHTVTAIWRYRGGGGTAVPTVQRQRQVAVTVWQILDALDTVVCSPDDGWRYHPKHVEQFPYINKLCNVASCWI